MELKIINVGNSKGLRFPKAILDEYKIEGSVELTLKEGYIEIHPARSPRKNWKKEFIKMRDDSAEEKLIPDVFEDEDL